MSQYGCVELLWKHFGGTVNEKGYKVLNPKVGLIYGDSITLERAEAILKGLEAKGFASSNIVFGVGSFTYQFNTRDSLGFAVKSTYGEIKGVPQLIFKDPITDSGVKKSLKGLIEVVRNDQGEIKAIDERSFMQWNSGNSMLKPVFKDGKLLKDWTLREIKDNATK